jgi:glycosyltransferase involved in cell wall biosynthesis
MNPGTGDTKRGRLLFVVNVAWFFISHRLPLAIAARAAGYDVHVATGGAHPDEISELERAGIVFHALDLKRSALNPIANLTLLWQLHKLYRSLRPDVVHHVTHKPVMLGTLVARFTGIAAVVNAFSGLGYTFSVASLGRRLLRRAIGLGFRVCLSHPHMIMIFQNENDRQEFGEWTRVDLRRSVLIAGSGVDLQRFRPTPEPAGPVTVVLPARMLRDKGVVEFSAAIARLRGQGVAVQGLLAGPIDLDNPASLGEPELRALEAKCGVQWLGHCADMPQLFSSAHIVCLPSYREGLPKALIEAAAAGRPLVTTDVPGCRQVVADGVNGLLVPAREVEPLVTAIGRLVADPQLRGALGAAARRRAEREFGLEQVVARTLGLYEQIHG